LRASEATAITRQLSLGSLGVAEAWVLVVLAMERRPGYVKHKHYIILNIREWGKILGEWGCILIL
jgi:hypothetical protein